MEWLIILIIIYLIWRVFFANSQVNGYIEEELIKIYNTKDEEKMFESYFFYDSYKNYAIRKGEIEQINGINTFIEFQENFNGEIYIFRFFKSNYSGKAYINMTNMSKFEKKIQKMVK